MIKKDLYRNLVVDPTKPSSVPRGILGDESALTNEQITKYTNHLTIGAHDREICSKGDKKRCWDKNERAPLKTLRLDFLTTNSDGKAVLHYHPLYYLPTWDDVEAFCPIVNKFTFEKFTIYGAHVFEPFTLCQDLPENCHTLVSVMATSGHHRDMMPMPGLALGPIAKSNVKSLVIVLWTDKSNEEFIPFNQYGSVRIRWHLSMFEKIIYILGYLSKDVTITIVGIERANFMDDLQPPSIKPDLPSELDTAGSLHNHRLDEHWYEIDDPENRLYTDEMYERFKFLTLEEYLADTKAWDGVLSPEQVAAHRAS
jgi:hypothetical protein